MRFAEANKSDESELEVTAIGVMRNSSDPHDTPTRFRLQRTEMISPNFWCLRWQHLEVACLGGRLFLAGIRRSKNT